MNAWPIAFAVLALSGCDVQKPASTKTLVSAARENGATDSSNPAPAPANPRKIAPPTPGFAPPAPVSTAPVPARPKTLEDAVTLVVRKAGETYGLDLPASPAKIADRATLVPYLGEIAAKFEEKAIYAAAPIEVPTSRLKPGVDPATLSRLIRDGYVAPYGPLATSSGPQNASQVGEALAYLLSRGGMGMALPSAEFTPILMEE